MTQWLSSATLDWSIPLGACARRTQMIEQLWMRAAFGQHHEHLHGSW
jgi:hypothetical protein